MVRVAWLLALIIGLTPRSGEALAIYGELPSSIHADERYVFYSHGRIVEGESEMPRHPEYGVYDFPKIKRALFDSGGFNLIAYHRPANADVAAQAKLLESWVRRLVAAGVKPAHITLIGFSKGGQITAYAADSLSGLGLNIALMGICDHGDFHPDPPLRLGGKLLSIYETSDVVGSCAKLAAHSSLVSFEEVSISTGQKHGAFFTPRPEWVGPLTQWIKKAMDASGEPVTPH
jgi:hypothetical protein